MNYTTGEWECTCEATYFGNVVHCDMHKAAPELYEALKIARERTITEITHHPEVGNYRLILQSELRQIDKALAKAEGKK